MEIYCSPSTEEVMYEKPVNLIAQIKELDKQRNEVLLNLENVLD